MCHAKSKASTATCHRLSAVGCLAAALAASVPIANAEESPNILTDPFQLSLGTYVVNTDTLVELNGDVQQGSKVNWEDTFGGGDLTRFRIDGHWRFGDSDRHKLRFLWFNSTRSKSKTIDEDIEWGDQVYPANAKVTGELKFDIYELAYEYAFVRRDTWELNASAGLHLASMSIGLKAKAADSNGTLLFDQHKDGKLNAPLPVFGLRGLWQLGHNIYLDAQGQYFKLSIDDFDGNVQDYRIVATWQPRPWLGVGLGYNRFAVDVDVGKDRFDGSLNWKYKGPMLFYSAVF
jgi:hypothetical protein